MKFDQSYNKRLQPSMTIVTNKSRKLSDKDRLDVPKFKSSPTIKICKDWIGDDESMSESGMENGSENFKSDMKSKKGEGKTDDTKPVIKMQIDDDDHAYANAFMRK
jgi:hypothetical protein